MYCPTCGVENAYGLRYCKRCGENLSNPANAPGVNITKVKQGEHGLEVEEIEAPGINIKKLSGMFWAVAIFGLVSLMTLLGSIIPLAILGAERRVIIAMLVLGTGAIVGISGMLIRQLSRLITMVEDRERSPQKMKLPLERSYSQIDSPPRPVSGVTEHTTRNFEHSVYNERRAPE